MAKRIGRDVDGNNSMGSFEIYLKRLLYDVYAYPQNGGQGPDGVVDFQFGEKMMYGRVNRDGTPIIYADRGTRQVPSTRGRTIEMVNFVADAYEEMAKKIKRDLRTGVIPSNIGFFNSFSAKSAYVSPRKVYANYNAGLYRGYVAYIKKYNLQAKVANVHGHYEVYQEYLNTLLDVGFSVSMSGFVRSRRADPAMTGLVIDLADFDVSNDAGKTNLIDFKFFDYYVGIARKHGFSVVKHIPTRLVADLDSPYMKKYMTRYSAPTYQDMLRLYYKPVWTEGYDLFKKDMINFYNQYAKQFPSYGGKSSKSRKPVHVQREMQRKTDKFYLPIYVEFRNKEESSPLGFAEKEYLKKRAVDLIQAKDIDAAVEYVEKEFSRFTMEANTFAAKRKKALGY